MSGIVVDRATYGKLSNERDPVILLADIAAGEDRGKVQEAVKSALRQYPVARVESNSEYLETFEDQLGQIVGLLYALLGMSVIISLFGIANSLFLTIHERTRELGLLRAIGSTRRQVNGMVTGESVITSVIGGLLGTAIGVFFAFLVTQALDDLGLGFSLPVGQLVFFLLLSVLVGVIGAIAPARRASRLSVLDALRAD
jgi:putative ABC transport system permease protein